MARREREPPGGGRFDEAGDATRRTRLANERTYLAWWRTGLTSFAVAIGSGRIVPAVAGGTTWPYTVVGVAFAMLGVLCSVYAFTRYREVDDAVRRGQFVHADDRFVMAMSALAALIGAFLIVALLATD
jgi:putative membrane protein